MRDAKTKITGRTPGDEKVYFYGLARRTKRKKNSYYTKNVAGLELLFFFRHTRQTRKYPV